MQIKATAQGQLDFVNNYYVLPFNLTCTDSPQNCEPYAYYGNQTQNWRNWDFELVLSQQNASSSVKATLIQFISTQNGNVSQKVPRIVEDSIAYPHDINVNPNCNSSGTQFCVTFFRRIFNGVVTGATPPPPNGPAGTWYVNWLVSTPQTGPNGETTGQLEFAPGNGYQSPGGDQTFQFPSGAPGLDPTTSFSVPWFGLTPPAWMQAPNPAAQLTNGEVSNNP